MPRHSAAILLSVSALLAAAVLGLLLVFTAGEEKIAGLTTLSGGPPTAPAGTAAADPFPEFLEAREDLPEAYPEVTLLAVGDIMLSRTVTARIKERGAGYPFQGMTETLRLADIVFGNLETPLTGGRDVRPGEMSFRADPGLARELRQAGFNVVSLANNHIPNFGDTGLRDTLAALDGARIRYAGAGPSLAAASAPAVIEAGGQNFEFLAYTDGRLTPASYLAGEDRSGTAPLDIEALRRDVTQAKNRGSIVVVSMHAGVEYSAGPDKVQTAFARAAVDAGADLVIGHHPHVVQTVETYKGKFIFYSLGNFIFDQDWSRETRDGLAVKAVWRGKRLARIDLLPVVIDESRPRLAAGPDSERILARLRTVLGSRSLLLPDGGGFRLDTMSSLVGEPPSGAFRRFRSEAADIDRDPPVEAVMLRGGRLSVLDDSGFEVWRSPAEWWVDDFALADSDGDGRVDINLSVWKTGSFGAARPFWVSGLDRVVGQHLFVMDYESGTVRPLWQSPVLSKPYCESLFHDIDGDGRVELVALEGDYDDGAGCRGRHLAVWEWDDRGFSSVWRSPAGVFSGLSEERAPSGPAVAVDSE